MLHSRQCYGNIIQVWIIEYQYLQGHVTSWKTWNYLMQLYSHVKVLENKE